MQGGWQPPGPGGPGGYPGGAGPGYGGNVGPAPGQPGGQGGGPSPSYPGNPYGAPPGGAPAYGAPPTAMGAPAPGFGGPPAPGFGGPPAAGFGGSPAPGFGGAPGAGQGGGYEFGHAENAVLASTATKAKVWGIVSVVLGVLQIFYGLYGILLNGAAIPYGFTGLANLVVGVSFLGAGGALRSVVDTQGNDIAHLMAAMKKLGTSFVVLTVALPLGVIFSIIIGILVAIFHIATGTIPT